MSADIEYQLAAAQAFLEQADRACHSVAQGQPGFDDAQRTYQARLKDVEDLERRQKREIMAGATPELVLWVRRLFGG